MTEPSLTAAALAPDQVVVSALGMVSSLGPGVVSSCAAARAGITRPRAQVDFEVLDEEAGETVPLAAHSVVGAEGFSGTGRLIRLGVAALRDLQRHAPLDRELLEETALVVNLATGFYQAMADGSEEREDGSIAFPAEAPPLESPELAARLSDMQRKLIPPILSQTGLGALQASTQVVLGDQAGFATALAAAMQQMAAGSAQRCIVGGIDSLIEHPVLAALLDARLLKTPANPVGLMPGESAAFLLLERAEAARARGARLLALIDPPLLLQGEPHDLSDEPVTGKGLATLIRSALDARPSAAPDLVLADCNGTYRNAMEWGSAQIQLPREVTDAPQWFPAAMFGVTGAAAGPVAACVAVRAFERRAAPGSEVLAWLASGRGDRAAVRITGGFEREVA